MLTGAAGFIGSYVAACFSSAGWHVTALDRNGAEDPNHPAKPHYDCYLRNNLTSAGSIIATLIRHRPEICIHLAGPASVGASWQNPVTDFASHTLPLFHLLEAIRLSGMQTRMLLVSSAAVYGNPESFPVNENQKIKPISPYGFHKCHQEMLLDQYCFLYGLKVCKARVFSTYGPGLKQLAVWDITRSALQGNYTVYGTGKEGRDYLCVKDVASALHCIVERASFSGEAINVASGQETRILTLAEMIYQELGIRKKPELLNGQKSTGNPTRWCADISRLQSLGFAQQISLEDGIRSTIQWIKVNV